jgi:hypothetical protein
MPRARAIEPVASQRPVANGAGVAVAVAVGVAVVVGAWLALRVRPGEETALGSAGAVGTAVGVAFSEPQDAAMIAVPSRPANLARILGLPWRPTAVACRARSIRASPPVPHQLLGATATLRVGPRSGKRHPS